MLLVPGIVYLLVSVILWRFVYAIFVPELIVLRMANILPDVVTEHGSDIFGALGRPIAVLNVAIIYFSAYFLFTAYWPQLKKYFGNPFLASLGLFGIHVLLLFPLLGDGIFGYRMARGPYHASLFLFAAHWVFARSLQFGERFRARQAELNTVSEA